MRAIARYSVPVSFAELLEGLPDSILEPLLATRGAKLDPSKILSRGEQAARALVHVPGRALASLTPSARDALDRLAPAPGKLARAELAAGARQLLELGLAFDVGETVVCPAAIRLSLARTPREDPRAARALLAFANEETVRDLLQAMPGRRGAPRALALGELLERLEDEAVLAREIDELPLAERLALAAIEARGGDVSSSELLSLAREPARWDVRGAIPKRGPAHALLARGLLFPTGHDRFALPSEVARVAGRERRAVLERRRHTLLWKLQRVEDDTTRADLATDPGPLAVALLIELTPAGELPRVGAVVRRTALNRVAHALAVSPERAGMLAGLARAGPLDALSIQEVGAQLFTVWRGTPIHDESRGPKDGATERTPSAIMLVRELALDTLRGLPRGRFVSVEDVVRAARADHRAEGIEAALRAPAGAALDLVLRTVLTVSLPALGVVDVAHDGTLRLAARASSLFGDAAPSQTSASDADLVRWVDRRARFSGAANVGVALALSPVARAAIDDGLVLTLDPERPPPLSVDPDRLARSLERALCPEPVVRAMLAALPAPVAAAVASAPAHWVPIDDPSLLSRLLEDPKIAREVVPGGPAGGVLLHAHGSFPRLVRLFAKHGIDLRKGA